MKTTYVLPALFTFGLLIMIGGCDAAKNVAELDVEAAFDLCQPEYPCTLLDLFVDGKRSGFGSMMSLREHMVLEVTPLDTDPTCHVWQRQILDNVPNLPAGLALRFDPTDPTKGGACTATSNYQITVKAALASGRDVQSTVQVHGVAGTNQQLVEMDLR